MNITITFRDDSLFTSSEAKQAYKTVFGNNAEVKIFPTSDSPESYIKFAIQELISIKQLEAYYDFGPNTKGYNNSLAEEKEEILKLVSSIFDKVIQENEERIEK